jgi:hypothetical protein
MHGPCSQCEAKSVQNDSAVGRAAPPLPTFLCLCGCVARVDLVAGPDAYRDLPNLISIVKVRGT